MRDVPEIRPFMPPMALCILVDSTRAAPLQIQSLGVGNRGNCLVSDGTGQSLEAWKDSQFRLWEGTANIAVSQMQIPLYVLLA